MHFIKTFSRIFRRSNQTYDEEFSTAARLGRSQKLDIPFVKPISTRYLNSHNSIELSKLFVRYSGFPNPLWTTKIVMQCITAHFLLLDDVERVLHSKPVLTLGWVEMGQRRFFECDKNDVLSWLKHGVPNPKAVNLHVWLTLQSMEIIDFTFVPSHTIVNKLPTKDLGFDVGHWTEFLDERRYHPIIVGNDIPQRLGLR